MEGPSSPSSRVKLTSAATSTLERHDPGKPLLTIIIPWSLEGVLGMWLHQAHSDLLKVTFKFEIAFCLALKVRGLARTCNREPFSLIVLIIMS